MLEMGRGITAVAAAEEKDGSQCTVSFNKA